MPKSSATVGANSPAGAALCPTHGSPLRCPKCMAALGGRSRSEKKLDAAAKNVEKATRERMKKRRAR